MKLWRTLVRAGGGTRLGVAGPPPGALTVLLLLGLAVTLALGGALSGRLWAQGQHGTAEQWSYHVWLESMGFTAHHRPAALGPGRTGADLATAVLVDGLPRLGAQLVAHPALPGTSPETTPYAAFDAAPPEAPPAALWRPAPARREAFTPSPLEPPDRPPRAGR